MIYLEHGMIIQHWLFTSLGGFRGSFWLKREISSFWEENIWSKNLVGGELVGRSDPSSSRKSVVGSWEKIFS